MTGEKISYQSLDEDSARGILDGLMGQYREMRDKRLGLDMSRGKPSPAQLDISAPMLTILKDSYDCFSEDGTDCRNYGVIDGIPEAKRLMSILLDDSPENVMVFGNSSLTVMHDSIARCLDFGCLGSVPWANLSKVSFICPTPGYDRHFAILEQFGIEMIPVEMTRTGPDMDAVERICAEDASVKGIWCVPKYSNPTGVTYSDETVRRLASMNCAATDFRIFWDNAYCVHHLYPDDIAHLLDIAKACNDAGCPDRYLKFASTSKITFPGAGISAMAASPANMEETRRLVSSQMIGADKLNQLRHARYLDSVQALMDHMNEMAKILLPKFELVEKRLTEALTGLDIATWTRPKGGYFVSFDGVEGSARRTVELAREVGVKLTDAGATYPYGKDPADRNIRIAPTMPSIEELDEALEVFCICVKIAALETILAK